MFSFAVMTVRIWLMLVVSPVGDLDGHERSVEMERALNAPVPAWLELADPIEGEVVRDENLEGDYRPRSGGAMNSRTQVWLPGYDEGIELPHSIDWAGNNEEGLGVSLNRDGQRLLVNQGMTTRLYWVRGGGVVEESEILVPHVTYDQGAKGLITSWFWAGDDLLVGSAVILDRTGHHVIEERFYVFDDDLKVLSRIDTSVLKASDDGGAELFD
ncbi:hypothetical protein [Sulfuriroseicoccus oceanibius]|uniref:Uncharacterized protein n=1 Tax=Sulfuriroseicoccus oceanibius TaxID=2707525 RepID=A0A6B3L9D0_9BACT|nr:hypothetical protein [Sulfuriroseicoccus oceanibius]QQL43824.1 hypothetical protein G3M56_007925 [Sulfuriroseicoccus oceanibius]